MFAELGKTQLTHELLVMLMAEVAAIVNARPIPALPSDPDDPQPLSPAMSLTMKTHPTGPPPGQFLPPDIYMRCCWRRVQFLAEQFWMRWRQEYLQSLQMKVDRDMAGPVCRRCRPHRDESQHQNDWPLGRVVEAIRSEDDRVRKVKVEVIGDGERNTYLRLIKELLLLLPDDGMTIQPSLSQGCATNN